ncbi:MAG: amidohydrolase family protein [Victivallales bacterium]|nr:amidohydrolase family protein [Victivallales bacterium]
MSTLPFYDVHTHVLHPKIAGKVIRQLEQHYHVPSLGTGELPDLRPRLRKAGISRHFVHTAATSPEQVVPANRWAVSLLKEPGVVPFGTMHPGYADWEAEFDFLYGKGVRGIKLHPDFQGFRLDDKALHPLFDAMAGRFTLMVHVGDLLPPAENPSCPWKVAAVKRMFPKLQIIVAHFGGVWHWPYVVETLKGLEVFLDTSSSAFAIPQALLESIFRAFPRQAFLFGSDYPLFDPSEERERLQYRLRLTDSELEDILAAGNALNLKPLTDYA